MTDLEIFKSITDKMAKIYQKKNADYGDSFSNNIKKLGMALPVVHISEKSDRLTSLYLNGKNEVSGEGFEDTLFDTANYCVLTLMEIYKNKAKSENDSTAHQ